MDAPEQGDVGKERWVITIYMQKPHRQGYNAWCCKSIELYPSDNTLHCECVCCATSKHRQRENISKVMNSPSTAWKTPCWWSRSARVWNCWKSQQGCECLECYLWLREGSAPGSEKVLVSFKSSYRADRFKISRVWFQWSKEGWKPMKRRNKG